MEPLIAPFLFSFLITLLATPLTIRFANKFGLVDDPQKRPHPAHIQNRVIPRAGGLPIFLSIFLGVIIFLSFDKHIAGILLAITLLLVVGLLDDYLKNFSPFPRLIIQFLAAAVVVASGVGIAFVTNPLGGILRLDQWVFQINFFGIHNVLILADLFALFWIVWMMNMLNWSKGVDGQMAGIAAAACLTIGLLSFKLFTAGDPQQLPIASLAFVVAGASLGFLIFNWHPAKIFPGFSASTILGFLIAVLSILSGAKLATALLVLLIPSVDFFYTILRRLSQKKSPFFGDQKHLHHLLLQRGWSHQKISIFYITTSTLLGLASINLSSEGKLFTVIGAGTIILGIIIWLQYIYRQGKQLD